MSMFSGKRLTLPCPLGWWSGADNWSPPAFLFGYTIDSLDCSLLYSRRSVDTAHTCTL